MVFGKRYVRFAAIYYNTGICHNAFRQDLYSFYKYCFSPYICVLSFNVVSEGMVDGISRTYLSYNILPLYIYQQDIFDIFALPLFIIYIYI